MALGFAHDDDISGGALRRIMRCGTWLDVLEPQTRIPTHALSLVAESKLMH